LRRARRAGPSLALLALAVVLAGCGSEETATTTTAPPANAAHAAPDLEALLPDAVDGKRLLKGSTTGAAVFGGNAFGRVMTKFLLAHGKRPQDLRFANARSRSLALEVGAFQVRGIAATALRGAIVAASRPNAQGLEATLVSLAGRRATKLVYPGGATLYLHPDGDGIVYHVATQNKALARRALARLP
jgi:hypothetical protein